MSTAFRRTLLLSGLGLAFAGTLAAHDLFLKLERFIVPPGSAVRIVVLNGTFTTSENAIARDRIADLSLVMPTGRTALDTTALTPSGTRTILSVRTGEPGTYVVGLSTRPRQLQLSGKEFSAYLREEAITEVLAGRQHAGDSDRPARERYAKHVKAILQVGDRRTEGWQTELGYPAELVPLENPYAMARGTRLRVRCLVQGQPAAGQPVIAGGQASGGGRIPPVRLTADAQGVVTLPPLRPGKWFVKFVRMDRAGETGLDYESRWSTLTFQVR